MRALIKTIHLVSLCVFFGSIATYIFLGAIIPEGDQQALALNREWVLTSTTYLTVISMCITGLTGLLLSGKPQRFWVWTKLLGFTVICLNTYFFVYPAIVESNLTLGIDEIRFQGALQNEAIFGAINVILILLLIVVAVIKPKLPRKHIK